MTKNNETETKKTTVTMPALPTKTPKTIEEFATYLAELDKIEDMSCKTWEKIPGCYSIKCRGRIVGEFYLSNKKGTYRISTRSSYFKTLPSNGSVIKNGLDLNVAKCDNITAGISFLRNVCHQFVDKANGKAVTLYEKDNFITEKPEPKQDKVEVVEG